ncbi:hypothetical protein J6590_034645 [Homalodisca vitripennis]|nr:hypothetical protein J6590_034645 [Homalodisca vitripennis]
MAHTRIVEPLLSLLTLVEEVSCNVVFMYSCVFAPDVEDVESLACLPRIRKLYSQVTAYTKIVEPLVSLLTLVKEVTCNVVFMYGCVFAPDPEAVQSSDGIYQNIVEPLVSLLTLVKNCVFAPDPEAVGSRDGTYQTIGSTIKMSVVESYRSIGRTAGVRWLLPRLQRSRNSSWPGPRLA